MGQGQTLAGSEAVATAGLLILAVLLAYAWWAWRTWRSRR